MNSRLNDTNGVFRAAIVFSLLFARGLFAQHPSLTNFVGRNEGFSESSVYSILCDAKGFMWYGTADGLWQYDGYKHIVYRHDPLDSTSISNNFIRNVFEDQGGNLWVCTLGGGLNILNPATGKFTRYFQTPTGNKKFAGKEISALTQDCDGNMWIQTVNGLERFNPKTGETKIFHAGENDTTTLQSNAISALMFDPRGKLFIGYSSEGFDMLDTKTELIQHYRVTHPDPILDIRSNVIRSITRDQRGNVWLGTYGGLVKFDPVSGNIKHFTHDDKNPNSLSHNSIWGLAVTRDDKLWVGTFGAGLSKLNLRTEIFENEDVQPGGVYGINSRELPSLYLDPQNTLWVGTNGSGIHKITAIPGMKVLKNTGDLSSRKVRKVIRSQTYIFFVTEAEGLYVYSPEKESLTILKDSDGLSSNQVVGAAEDGDKNIWIGTNNGLNFYDVQRRKIRQFQNDPNNNRSLPHNSILCTFVDSKGGVWIGHAFGLAKWDAAHEDFLKVKLTSTANPIYRMIETHEGLWLGSTRNGLYFLDRSGAVTKNFSHRENDKQSIASNYVTALYEDSTHILWVGTNQGLNSLHPGDTTFTSFDKLPRQRVAAITEDSNHHIIAEFEDNYFRIIPRTAPLISRLSNPLQTLAIQAHWSSRDNSVYVQAGNHVAVFSQDSIRPNPHVPPVAITQFRLYSNTKHKFPLSDTTFSSSYLERVNLPYEENVFSVEFAALDFTNPGSNQYAYKLDGFDDDWIYCGTRRFITYTNLDPGDYTLHVKGSNGDGVWNETGTSLALHIEPPFYRTWWAYALYIFVLAGILFRSWRAVVNRERLMAQIAIAKKEKQTLQELDSLKNRFFANITHEFRTPLTLIQGPTDRLIEKASDHESRQLLGLIKNNSSRLLTLINQLLDFARFDAREMKSNPSPVQTGVFLRTIISQFSSLAASKNIEFISTLPENMPWIVTDQEKVETIITNLVANALKFTQSGGRVEVAAQWRSGVLTVAVKDSGRGIPNDKIKYIFDRFYQVEPTDSNFTEGTGIGLALVKEYITLLGGTIYVSSEIGKGTEFKFSVPAPATSLSTDSAETRPDPRSEADDEAALMTKSQPLVLLVEDNDDIRLFIRSCLGQLYNYVEAKNGKEGLNIALEQVPDLIISDLMMPEMDGIELCERVKRDKRTDHVPFIMLTAKAGHENKIEGLRSGADDYLVKPFNKTELSLKIQNLIVLRERLQARIKTNLLSKSWDVKAVSLEEQFVAKARAFIDKNMSDETLSVERLAGEMGLSREQCYRKVMALTGLSPSALIRSLRLHRAAQLLASRWGPVSQVAYETGFGNLSYFSKIFREEFGKLPSEFLESDFSEVQERAKSN